MKIAIPVKTNKDNPILSPLFGKAKWFAFVEGDSVRIEKNETQGGIRVVDWLLEEKIDALIIAHMGNSPYTYFKEGSDVSIFYAGEERVSLQEVIQKFEDETLVIVDDSNSSQIIRNH